MAIVEGMTPDAIRALIKRNSDIFYQNNVQPLADAVGSPQNGDYKASGLYGEIANFYGDLEKARKEAKAIGEDNSAKLQDLNKVLGAPSTSTTPATGLAKVLEDLANDVKTKFDKKEVDSYIAALTSLKNDLVSTKADVTKKMAEAKKVQEEISKELKENKELLDKKIGKPGDGKTPPTGLYKDLADNDAAISRTNADLALNMSKVRLKADKIVANDIEAGAIGTDQLAAGAVTAKIIKGGEINGTHIHSGSINAGHIVGNSITGDKIKANTITGGNLVGETITGREIHSGAINANKIQSGAITTEKLAAKSITAEKLALVPGDIFPDPFFEADWGDKKVKDGLGAKGYALRIPAVGSQIGAYSPFEIFLKPSTWYRMTADVYVHPDLNGRGFSVYFSSWWKNNQYFAYFKRGAFSAKPAGQRRVSLEFKTRDDFQNNGRYQLFKVGFYLEGDSNKGLALISNVHLSEMASAELIVDGAITAKKIQADSITGREIHSDSIEAKHIKTGQITSQKIAAGAIQASHLTISPGNMFPDPMFKSDQWSKNEADTVHVIRSDNYSELNVLARQNNTISVYMPNESSNGPVHSMHIDPGEKYLFSLLFEKSYSQPATVTFYLCGILKNGYKYGDSRVCSFNVDHRGIYSHEFTAPDAFIDGFCDLKIQVLTSAPSGRLIIKYPTIVKKVTADLIVDGSITAEKLKADSITVRELKANTIIPIGNSLIPMEPISNQNIPEPIWHHVFDKVEKDGKGIEWRYCSRADNKQYVEWVPERWVKVDPNATYLLSYKIRGKTPNSRLYLEIKNQNGNNCVANNGGELCVVINRSIINADADVLKYAENPAPYLINNKSVPGNGYYGEYQNVKIRFTKDTEYVRLAGVYFNHSNSNVKTRQYLADLTLTMEVPSQKEIDATQDQNLETFRQTQNRINAVNYAWKREKDKIDARQDRQASALQSVTDRLNRNFTFIAGLAHDYMTYYDEFGFGVAMPVKSRYIKVYRNAKFKKSGATIYLLVCYEGPSFKVSLESVLPGGGTKFDMARQDWGTPTESILTSTTQKEIDYMRKHLGNSIEGNSVFVPNGTIRGVMIFSGS